MTMEAQVKNQIKLVPVVADVNGRLLVSTNTPIASDGEAIPLDMLAQSLVYNSDNTLNYVQVVFAGVTYRQTFTYTSGNLTGISAWVKQ